MVSRKEWRWVAVWALALVAVAGLPYLIAYLATPDGLFYSGFLTNPEDGYTYLAKARQGWRGDWLYRLAFAPDPHEGEFVFTYYLLLGHISRWTRLPIIIVLHLARSLNGFALLLVLYYAFSWMFEKLHQRRFAFLITALGSGLGWLATFVVDMTVDLWVPEGYIFYSIYANPHFPLAIALVTLALVWSVTPWDSFRVDWRRLAGVAGCTAALGIVLPFSLLPLGVVLLLYAIVHWTRCRRLPWRELASGVIFGVVALPFVVNGYLASTQNPLFAAWSEQNQTLSPPPWNYALGYGVVLVLAVVGGWHAARRRRESDLFVLSWALSTAVLLYLPISLQRRFVMGWIVPLGALATVGWYALPERWRQCPALAWGLASLTHVFLVGMSIVMAMTGHEAIYMSYDERVALRWMSDQVSQDALVAAAPQTGLYIPGWAGQRVYYGHRFESAYAELRRKEIEAFFATGDLDVLPYRPDYVFLGPNERELNMGDWRIGDTWETAYRVGAVTILAVPQE